MPKIVSGDKIST